MNIKVKLTRSVNYQHFNVQANTIVEMDIEQYLRAVVASEIANSP